MVFSRERGWPGLVTTTISSFITGRISRSRALMGRVRSPRSTSCARTSSRIFSELPVVIRGRAGHPAVVGRHVLVGPHAHVNGAVLDDGAFIATGASVFPGARVGTGAEVRINGVVHVNSVLPEEATVPIGWVAVGDPARILPPSDHEGISAVQRTLDFVGTVYGVRQGPPVEELDEITRGYAELFGHHRDDRVLG